MAFSSSSSPYGSFIRDQWGLRIGRKQKKRVQNERARNDRWEAAAKLLELVAA